MKFIIIGAGWYGCHLALALATDGHEVVLMDKNADILEGTSGHFGIRLHKGPHYPRSDKTRKSCIRNFYEFMDAYPELIVEHDYSIYGLGRMDAKGNPSKVNVEQFKQVFADYDEYTEIELSKYGFRELDVAMDIEEPSILLGNPLRAIIKQKLADANVTLQCNSQVLEIQNINGKPFVKLANRTLQGCDEVINATGYQALIPSSIKENFPVDMEVKYQTCLALKYRDTTPGAGPFSFIVMDGFYPCIMPCADEDTFQNKYKITHGSYTIMGSYSTPDEAHKLLNSITSSFVNEHIKPKIEAEMQRFWPEFTKRFVFETWEGTVLAKLFTKKEFRSAVTFKAEGVMHVIPGKVSNIFDVEREVKLLIQNQQCTTYQGVQYVIGGALDEASMEIEERPGKDEPNTGTLDTYKELTNTPTYNMDEILKHHLFAPRVLPKIRKTKEDAPSPLPKTHKTNDDTLSSLSQ